MASRAVDSQHTLVAVPVMIRVSIPRASKMSCRSEEPGTNAPKRVLSTMESFACTLELRPQLEAVAAAAGGFVHRLAAVGRRKIGEPSRPLGDRSFVNQVPDENVEAARCADRGADPVDVRHDLPRLGNLDGGARLHESVLEVDDDVRGPRRIEMIKHVGAAPQCLHAIHHRRRNFDFMHAHLLYARASARWSRYRDGKQSSYVSSGRLKIRSFRETSFRC